MTSDELVFNTITDGTKTPGARMTWGPPQCVPPLPYFTYGRTGGGELFADGRNHAALPRYRVTLFAKEPDEALEELFARAVANLGPYSRSWEYDDEHDAYVTHFDFTVTGVPS